MQRFTIRLIVALATFFIGITTATVPTAFRFGVTTDVKEEQELLKVERDYIDAHVQRNTALLDRVLADDFTITRFGGRVTNKAERMALVEDPDFKFISIDTDHVRVQTDGDQAVVTGQAVLRGRYQDREFISPRYKFTRIYHRRQGRWQVVAVQLDHIPQQ